MPSRPEAVMVAALATVGMVAELRWDMAATVSGWVTEQGSARVDALVVLVVLVQLVLLVRGRQRARALRRELARKQHQALHDPLTGLSNRTLFFDRMAQAVASSRRHGTVAAVLLLDLDGFKETNDTFGHAAGDALLQQVADRLTGGVREVDTVARLGGDEFAVVLTDAEDVSAVSRCAVRFLGCLTDPFVVAGTEMSVRASVGVAVHLRDGGNPDELLRNADAAMYAAKRRGGGIAHYDAARDDAALRLAALRDLRTGIEQGQLRLHYQPSVRFCDRVVTGAEAVVRWQHPTRGLLAPAEFLPLAEQSDLITPLTVWVLDEAVAQCRQWAEDGLDLCVAVNLSARSVVDERLPEMVRHALERHRLTVDRLVVEITETSLINRPEDARRILGQLNTMGVNIAIDDFGTGYATLAWLQVLPFNALKIDRTFVADVLRDGPGAELVRYTTQLAHAMGKVVVAEGVETQEQWVALERMGCDHAQGFGVGRPVPGEEFRRWLAQWESSTALSATATGSAPAASR